MGYYEAVMQKTARHNLAPSVLSEGHQDDAGFVRIGRDNALRKRMFSEDRMVCSSDSVKPRSPEGTLCEYCSVRMQILGI